MISIEMRDMILDSYQELEKRKEQASAYRLLYLLERSLIISDEGNKLLPIYEDKTLFCVNYKILKELISEPYFNVSFYSSQLYNSAYNFVKKVREIFESDANYAMVNDQVCELLSDVNGLKSDIKTINPNLVNRCYVAMEMMDRKLSRPKARKAVSLGINFNDLIEYDTIYYWCHVLNISLPDKYMAFSKKQKLKIKLLEESSFNKISNCYLESNDRSLIVEGPERKRKKDK